MEENKVLPLFSELINDVMYLEVKSNRRLVEGLGSGVRCSMRDIQRYRTGEQVPDYVKARAILEFLKIDVVEEDLRNILTISKEHAHNIRKNKKVGYGRYVSLNTSNINLDMDIDSGGINELIKYRIMELYGEEGTAKKYIEALIEKDLNENILGD